MRKYRIIPKGLFVGKRKIPLIGSGRISRRVIITAYRENNQKTILINRSPVQIKKQNSMFDIHKKTKTRIEFKSSESRIIFYYWQRLGFPFVKHREEKTVTSAKAIALIERYSKRYGKGKIIESMEKCQKLFNSDWFKYKLFYQSRKIRLIDFFNYPGTDYVNITKRLAEIPRSWFQECLKPFSKLEFKYGIIRKNKFQRTAERLIQSWRIYKQGSEPTDFEKNTLGKTADILYEYCRKNNLDILMVTGVVDKMLNEWHTYKPKHTGWLKSEIFINETLPNELVRFGAIDHKTKKRLKQ